MLNEALIKYILFYFAGYLACQIGFRFQKRKMYSESLTWCDRARIAHEAWKTAGSREVEVKVRILIYANLNKLLMEYYFQ